MLSITSRRRVPLASARTGPRPRFRLVVPTLRPLRPVMASAVPPSLSDPSAILRVYGAHPFHTDGDLLALAFAPDGTLWSVEDAGVLRRWDLAAQQQIGWHHLEELATLWSF